jgi:hypothetical protein
VSATLFLAPTSRSPTTVTATSVTTATQTMTLTSAITSTEATTLNSVATKTETSTSTSVTTTTETTTTTSVVTLPSGCLPSQSYGYSTGTLVAGARSPAIICVQVYWFNSTAPLVLNATSLLQIEGCEGCGTPGEGEQLSDAGANFTVAASVDQLLLGGPTNANEGTILALSITAKPGASGIYQLALQRAQLESEGGYESCPNGDLVAGNGQPNYVPPNEICLPIIITGGTQFSIPGLGYTAPGGVLLYRIISLTNSTQ